MGKQFTKYVSVAEKQSAFLTAFFETFRIDLACEKAGIGRATYYKWMHEDIKFKERFEETKEAFFDKLESRLLQIAEEKKDTNAIIQFLKAKAKHRGWGESVELNHSGKVIVEFVDRAAVAEIKNKDEADDADTACV